ncbi:MAG: isopentenyl-diphosphate Delta-isomerase [Micropruina sp.]|nr:isopentenyl-diphosphate Delta-isomerase [Micropruina sp.]
MERHLLRHDHDPDAVVLLDDAGRAVGQRDRFAVHTENTPLHLAFSSYLFDDAGRVLLTRRALNKLTWPGVWTNSCCGHPRPGGAIPDAVARRVREEVGLTVRDLRCVLPDFRYRAVDTSGIVENEICPVFVGRVDPSQLILDPDEVLDHTWVSWADLTRAVASADRVFSPWAALQVPLLDAVLAPETPHTADLPGVESTLELVQAELTQQSERLARQWSRFIPAGSPGILGDDLPAWLDRLASVGGKRLRANLCHWGFVAVGGDVDSAGHQHLITAAAALELLHFFALVHDDVMDDSDTRRGMASAHVQAARWHRQAQGQGTPTRSGATWPSCSGIWPTPRRTGWRPNSPGRCGSTGTTSTSN